MKRLKLPAIFIAALILLVTNIGTIGVQASEHKIPNPTTEFYFNDFSKVLDPNTGRDIVRLGESTYKSTDGGQVVFVSIDTLNDSTIEEYANALFNKWGIGTGDKGVLFILSMKERESRIEVGYGYEGILTDIESNKLLVKFSELNEEIGINEAVMTIYSDICSIVNGKGDEVQYSDTGWTRRQKNTDSSIASNPVMTAILVIAALILLILDFVLTGGQVTFFILRMLLASSRRGGGGGRRNSGGGCRSGGGGSSSRF